MDELRYGKRTLARCSMPVLSLSPLAVCPASKPASPAPPSVSSCSASQLVNSLPQRAMHHRGPRLPAPLRHPTLSASGAGIDFTESAKLPPNISTCQRLAEQSTVHAISLSHLRQISSHRPRHCCLFRAARKSP